MWPAFARTVTGRGASSIRPRLVGPTGGSYPNGLYDPARPRTDGNAVGVLRLLCATGWLVLPGLMTTIRPMRRVAEWWGGYFRWMYRGGPPNRWARWQNRLSAALFGSGLIMPERLVTMEVPGRRTGGVISLPLVVADYQGERYLVAMLGEGANWVRNVRAAGGRVVLRHGRRESVRLSEVAPEGRAPILRRHLAVAPGARPHVGVSWHTAPLDLERIAARTPVFRVGRDTQVSEDGR